MARLAGRRAETRRDVPGEGLGDQSWDIATRPADLVDGASYTLLVGENALAGAPAGNAYSGGLPTNWACPLPNFCMFIASDDVCRSPQSSTDCLGGQLRPGPGGRDGAGWSLANRAGTFESMNDAQQFTTKGSFPFINSPHAQGANFVCCDGSVRFIRTWIDGTVYAKLVTPAGSALPEAIRQGALAPEGGPQ